MRMASYQASIIRAALGVAALAFVHPSPVWAQLQPFDRDRGLPQGLQVNTVSFYGGVYSLGLAASSGLPSNALPAGSTFTGGFSADTGWYRPGRHSQMFVDYQIGYEGDARYPNVGGLSHLLNFGVETKPTRSTEFKLLGTAQSSIFSDGLFRTSAEAPQTLDDLIQDTSPGAGGPSLVPSPIGVALFGMRRNTGSMDASLSVSSSPSLSWHVSARASRDLPAQANDSAGLNLFAYPAVTFASLSTGVSYQLAEGTRIGFDLESLREYSHREHRWSGSGLLTLTQTIGQRCFARAEGGYGVLADARVDSRVPIDPDYLAGLSIGAKTRANTFTLGGRRELQDQFGLGSGTTETAELAWKWHRPVSDWAVEIGLGYQRLGYAYAAGTSHLDGYLARGSISRRLADHFYVVIDLIYASDSGQFGAEPNNLIRRAARLSVEWTPGRGRLR